MDTFENLWRSYLRTQQGPGRLASDQISALRHAFFSGAWCQMKLTNRMIQEEDAMAIKLMAAAELELSDAMKAPHDVGARAGAAAISLSPQRGEGPRVRGGATNDSRVHGEGAPAIIPTFFHTWYQATQMKTPMKRILKFTLLTGWLIPGAMALWYFSRWIREIVVPTLKGGNFDQLYDLHGVPYLHLTMWLMVPAFAWGTLVAILVAAILARSKNLILPSPMLNVER